MYMTFIWSVVIWIFHEFHIFLMQTPVLTYATVILRSNDWRMELMWNACKEICSREYFMQHWHGIRRMNTEKWNLFEVEHFFAIRNDWCKRVRRFKIINRERLHSTIMINLLEKPSIKYKILLKLRKVKWIFLFHVDRDFSYFLKW